MLKEEDHEELVRVMTQAAMEDGFEFNVVESESRFGGRVDGRTEDES